MVGLNENIFSIYYILCFPSGVPIKNAIITVPPFYTQAQRKSILLYVIHHSKLYGILY